LGMMAAAGSALLVYGCRTEVPKEDLPKLLASYLPGYAWESEWDGRVLAPGFHAVHAALTAIVKGNTLSSVLWECINYTGDVDTVAAIAVAAASMHPDIPNNLHPDLYDGLETGPYGHKFLIGLDESLKGVFLDPIPEPVEDEGDETGSELEPFPVPEGESGVLSMFDFEDE